MSHISDMEDLLFRLLSLLPESWGLILAGVIILLDIVTRVWPSLKDYSIINWIVGLYDKVVPNLYKGGGQHAKVKKFEPDSKPLIVKSMKEEIAKMKEKIKRAKNANLILILVFAAFAANGQVVQDVTVNYINTGPGAGILVDTVQLSDGTTIVTETPVSDTSTLAAKAVSDSTDAQRKYNRYAREFQIYDGKVQEYQSLKTDAQKRRDYYLSRKQQLNAELTEIKNSP